MWLSLDRYNDRVGEKLFGGGWRYYLGSSSDNIRNEINKVTLETRITMAGLTLNLPILDLSLYMYNYPG